MHRAHAVTALALCLLLACSSGGTTPQPQPGVEDSAGPVVTEGVPGAGDGGGTEDAPDAAVGRPEAELEGDCTKEPRDPDGDGVLSVESNLTVRNTGNIGAKVRVASTWRLSSGELLTKAKRVRLEVDQSRKVEFRIDLAATEAQLIQEAAAENRDCYSRVRVVGAFGIPGA